VLTRRVALLAPGVDGVQITESWAASTRAARTIATTTGQRRLRRAGAAWREVGLGAGPAEAAGKRRVERAHERW